METAGTQGPLLTFDPNQVTGIRIDVPDGEPILVAQTESGWVIPALGDLPAADSKVDDLLAKLGGLEKGLPVATSEEALKRFKVSDRVFERKLTLEGGDRTLAALYLGDSPGFRRLFVRADGDDAVYEAQLGLFDAPDKPYAWSDRTLLHLDTDSIQRLTLPDLTLERTEDGWRLANLAAGEEQDAEAIEDLVRMLARIDFVGVMAAEEPPVVGPDSPPIEIEATLASGDPIRYRITKLEEGNDYLLTVSNRPQRFRLAGYAAEDLTGIARADLLKDTGQAAEVPLPAAPTASPAAQVPAATEHAAPAATTTQPQTSAPATGTPEESSQQREP
jgi:hypothetical protein